MKKEESVAKVSTGRIPVVGESQPQLLGEVRQDLAEGHPRALQRLQRHGAGVTEGPRRTAGGTGNSLGVGDGSLGPARTDGRRLGPGGEEMGGSQGLGAAVQSDTKSVRHEVTQSGERQQEHSRVGDARPFRRPRGPRPPRAHVLRRRKSKSRRPPASGDARPLQSPLVVGGARCRLAAWDYDSDIGAGE